MRINAAASIDKVGRLEVCILLRKRKEELENRNAAGAMTKAGGTPIHYAAKGPVVSR